MENLAATYVTQTQPQMKGVLALCPLHVLFCNIFEISAKVMLCVHKKNYCKFQFDFSVYVQLLDNHSNWHMKPQRLVNILNN